jgi:hypothetical protein
MFNFGNYYLNKCDQSQSSLAKMFTQRTPKLECHNLYSSFLPKSHFISGTQKWVLSFSFLGQRSLVPLLLLGPPFFSIILFRVHHLVTQGDRQLLAHAMASDFSVAWQCLSKRTIVFLLYGSNSTPEMGSLNATKVAKPKPLRQIVARKVVSLTG